MTPLTILIDADACPVKDEIYRVAERFRADVRVVSNAAFRIPDSPRVKRVVVSDSFDAADDWIAEAAAALPPNTCVVVTGDILLADRCLKAGARVLKHNGEAFTAASIGGAIATRAIMADLRAGMDGVGGGPAPFSKADRSRFLQALDRVLVGMGRG
ncbi:MAG: YaiI/YqxD family protein [Sphingomonadales bacterium]|nr:YaiI/YqxD family protein [Sphingomonadales bacterium]NCQ21076.1 YaiI/YqxD family protein [Sphingomonadales bacterium]NCT03865.1 YaiI/YqxD family protein [Sphingomonadales bacterium]